MFYWKVFRGIQNSYSVKTHFWNLYESLTSDVPPCSRPLEFIQPLATRAEAWQAIPGVSEWVMGIIKRGYSLQFARRPPRFSGVVSTSVQGENARVLRSEVMTLLEKAAIEMVPPALSESGFYSRYFLFPKKNGGLRPILDLRHLNHALMRRLFRMITLKQILSQIRTGDWFCSLDLKDAYFHIQIAPHHRRFLRFAFEGVAYQYTVLPFGLSLAPCTKCMDTALSPLRQMGIRILNYLDDWLILAQSEVELLSHRTLILSHLERLGLRVNFAKSALSPSQRVSFLGTVLDSAHMRVSKCFRECWTLWPQHRQCYSWACSACAPFNAGWNHRFHTTHGVTDACISGWIRPV